MSIPKPPGRSRRDPDYDSADLLPPEEAGGEWDDEVDDEPEDDGDESRVVTPQRAESARTGRNGAGRAGDRSGSGANGRAATIAAPPEEEEDEEASDDDLPEVETEPTPVAATVVATSADGLAAAPAADLRVGEWLNRRWLFGLANWQAILVVLLAIALVITRFYNLGDRAMHHDESMHAKFAWDTYHGNPIYKYNPLLHGPFQFLAVATSFWLFGATEWTARAVPATFGILLVCLTVLWRRWLGTAGWLLAMAIFIFSPSFTYFARMLREDSYTATWTLLAVTGFVGYVLHRRRPWFYAFCGGLAMAFATKESTYITAFILGTFMILSLLWEHTNTWQRRVIAGAAVGALVGAFYSMVIGYYKKELHEVGGAVIGLVAGAVLGYVYNLARPTAPVVLAVDAEPAPRVETKRRRNGVAPMTPAARRRAAAQAAQERASRPEGRITAALRTVWQDGDGFWGIGTFWGGVILFFALFVLFFSSFFTNLPGVREGLVGSIRYWLEQHGVQRGNQPWFYYLLILAAYETLPFVFALWATVYYLRKPTWLTTFLIWYAATALTIYSWAGEKMPWLIIHITTPMVLLTARFLGELFTSALRNVWEKRIAWASLGVLGLWTIHTGWPVNFERPDTPKDLLVYTQTAPDVKKVMADIQRISLEQTGDAYAIGVTVQSGTWWPFSWYLRDFKNVDYPSQLTAPATKPIVLVALEDDDKNRPYLQGYTRTKYKMRWWYPEDYRSIPDEMKKSGGLFGYLARKDVRDGLWKWLIYRETTQPLGSYDFYVYMKEGLGGPGSAAGIGAATDNSAQQPPLPGQQGGQQPANAANQSAQQRQLADQYAAKTVPLTPLLQFGTAGKGTGQLNTPRKVALDSQGNLYVADTLNHRIQKFDRSGKLLMAFGTEGGGDGQFKEPMGVTVDPQGNIYVADTWNHRIQKFDATGKFLTKWQGQGGFWGPRDIALDGQGNVYVSDTGNKRIQKFDSSGRFLGQFGTGGAGPGQLNEPIGLAVTAQGDMFIADTNNKRVQHLDFTGKQVAEWPVGGWQTSARTEPYIALDAQGNVYITDPPNARIVKFSPDGEVLAVAGGLGKGAAQLDVPLGIAVADDGTIIVTDSNNNRVSEFAALQ